MEKRSRVQTGIERKSTFMVDVPHELMENILSRLPGKSLIRFRCVSKPWSHLISNDDSFINTHLIRTTQRHDVNLIVSRHETFERSVKYSRHKKDSGVVAVNFPGACLYGIDVHSYNAQYSIKSPLDFYDEETSINMKITIDDVTEHRGSGRHKTYVGHGNHVISGRWTGLNQDMGKRLRTEFPLYITDNASRIAGSCNGIVCLVRAENVCLLNPCTREYRIVGFGNKFNDGDAYGFGYDSTSKDYKLVQFPSPSTYFYVHSFNDSSRLSMPRNVYRILYRNELGVFLNGALHWVAGRRSPKSSLILSYVFEEKTLDVLPRPIAMELSECADMNIGVLQGKLCTLCNCGDEVDMWVMNTYGVRDSWIKLLKIEKSVLNININAQQQRWNLDNPSPKPMLIGQNGEVILKKDNVLVLYEPEKKTATAVKIYGVSSILELKTITTHLATLVRLNTETYLPAGSPDSESDYLYSLMVQDVI